MPQRGFTLLELMVGAAVAAIVLMMVASTFSDYMANAVIRDVAEEMNQGLRRARVEAIARNTTVQFEMSGSTWSILLASTGTTLVQRTSYGREANLLITPSTMTVTFNGMGAVSPPANYQVLMTNPSQGTCIAEGGAIRCLQVEVMSGGSAKTCDPALASTDPRSC